MNEVTLATINNGNRFENTTTPRFTPVNSGDILGTLEAEGWQVNRTSVTRTRDQHRQPFARHLVTMRQKDDILALADKPRQVGDLVRELRLMNGNDGTQAVEIMAGFMRLVCLNGLTVGQSFVSYKIKHSARPENLRETLRCALEGVGEQFAHGETVIQSWQKIEVTSAQARNLAGFAVAARFGSFFRQENVAGMVTPDFMRREFAARVDSVLQVRRSEDRAGNLWTVFNRVQENIIRGGWTGTTPRTNRDGVETLGTRKVRGVSAVRENVALNRSLWDAGESIAKGEVLALPELVS